MLNRPRALYYKPSYERLKERIDKAAPELDIFLMDEEGQLSHDGKAMTLDKIHPDMFWIHSELFFSKVLENYFETIEQCSNVAWLHTINTGLDRGPYLDLLRQGVTITNNHSQAIAIAEYVMAHVLDWFQNLADYAEKQQQGIWKYRPFRELSGSYWLIIGFGHIGQQLARRAKAFGVHLVVVRRGNNDEGLADEVCSMDNMDDALSKADVVVLACASNDKTRNRVDAGFLEQMKDDAILVNIARGDLVVEEDLRTALDAGKPGGAILDVFNQEPPAPDSWVWQHPRVRLTPHCSNGGSGMRQRSDDLFIENLYRMMNGQNLVNVVAEKDIV